MTEEDKRHQHVIFKHKTLWAEAGGVFKPPCIIDEPVKAAPHQVGVTRDGGGDVIWREDGFDSRSAERRSTFLNRGEQRRERKRDN